jgi:hypothetical protein
MISRQSPCFQDARERYRLPPLIASRSTVAVALRSSCGLYDVIGHRYAAVRVEDPRLARPIGDALGDARTVVHVGAGAGSYEHRDREVVAVDRAGRLKCFNRPARRTACSSRRWRRRESNPRRRSASDESQEDPDLASADAGESASKDGHKRQAASTDDDELPAIHPGQLNVFDLLGDG